MKTVAEHVQLARQVIDQIRAIIEMIEGEVLAQPGLESLTRESGSGRLPIWRRWVYVFGFLSWIQLESLTRAQADIQKIVDSSSVGTAPWYSVQVRNFQLGDNLQLDRATGKYSYAVINPAKRVVKHAAMTNGLIKVAGEDGSGKRQALTPEVMLGLNAYLERVGVWLAVPKAVTYPGDLMQVSMDVYYNALVNVEKVKQGVNEAILKYVTNLDFDGIMYLSRLQDAVQAVEGVRDVRTVKVEARHNLSSYAVVERIYQPISGYMEIDPEAPLQNTIKYLPS